jgi:hypothetical protein
VKLLKTKVQRIILKEATDGREEEIHIVLKGTIETLTGDFLIDKEMTLLKCWGKN